MVDADVSTVAGSGNPGWIDGVGTLAAFFNPRGVAIDAFGIVLVVEEGNNVIRRVTPSGGRAACVGLGWQSCSAAKCLGFSCFTINCLSNLLCV